MNIDWEVAFDIKFEKGQSVHRFVIMHALLHGNVSIAGAERTGLVGTGAIDFFASVLAVLNVAVEHAGDIRHPAVRASRRFMVVCSLDLCEDLGNARLDFRISISD